MSGRQSLFSVYAKLDWAASRHDEMHDLFRRFLAESDRGTPYRVQFRTLRKPPGTVRATFGIERDIPVEMSLLAGDLVHNTRVALDQVLAALKQCFGGDPGQGSFPVCAANEEWERRVMHGGRNRPLRGLEGTPAFNLVERHQPFHRDEADPLLIVNRLDNDDKHRLLHRAFFYTDTKRGVDLIEVLDSHSLVRSSNHWVAGEPLEDGTRLATFHFRSRMADPPPLRVRRRTPVGFAIGPRDVGAVFFDAMIDRVREVADDAAAVIGQHDATN